jgi:hypothetical protein
MNKIKKFFGNLNIWHLLIALSTFNIIHNIFFNGSITNIFSNFTIMLLSYNCDRLCEYIKILKMLNDNLIKLVLNLLNDEK